jgi:hypothetical protein
VEAGPETVRASLLAVAENTTDQVAFIVGRYHDLLGGNRLAYALFGLRPGQQANMARQMREMVYLSMTFTSR